MSKYIIPFLAYSMFILMIWGMFSMNNNIVTLSFIVGYFSAVIGSKKGKKDDNKKNE